MSKIIGEPEPWPQTIPEEIAQQYADTCAVKSQQIVMKTFGIDIPEDQLAIESAIKGYYMPGEGSDPDFVGRLLNDHGIETHSEENANVYDLVNELAQGHKVIVGVDADELWRPTWYNDIFGEQANHALVVTGIDTTDPENVKVIITDPGTGDVAKEYPLDQFLDAWHDSNCFYVATNAPAPANNPEMSGFDFEAGHIPFVCNIPYDSYEPLVEQFGIFHDDIIKHMNECLDNLNEVSDDSIYSMDDFHSAFAHMECVEQMMQDSWNSWDEIAQDQSAEICDHLVNDFWDWNTCQSTLPDVIDIDAFDIDAFDM
ncbi:MAG: C39 family peptidase [Bacteroidaceae bacterium]|nr:C39 family peptidase [Bacteroidaceae bacterium]